MARRRRGSGRTWGSNESLPRDPLTRLFDLTSPLSPAPLLPDVVRSTGWQSDHAASDRSPVRSSVSSRSSVQRAPFPDGKTTDTSTHSSVKFTAAKAVAVCIDRQQRREVLFASRKAGFSGSAPGPYRRSAKSKIRC